MSLCAQLWDFDDQCGCAIPDGTDEELITHWQTISSGLLHDASGRHVGTCEVTVRPCLRRCGGGSGLPVPYKGADGAWRNYSACGCTEDCSCTELCEVILDGPVASVTSVSIDGTDLDPDQYRLDKVGTGWRLLRIDGSCWPSCQDMNAACDEVGSFCVTYLQGVEPDALAIAANSQLTCNLVLSCLGCPCDIPKNATSVTTRGKTITLDVAKPWLRGLSMVAAFLDAVNPEGLTSASSVWSPDVARTRRMLAPDGS